MNKRARMIIQKKRAVTLSIFLLIMAMTVLLTYGAKVISGDEGTASTKIKNETETTPSPLLPVIIGGLIAFVGSIGGGTLVFFLQSRNETKVFKRSKIEELSALACQCDDWLDQLMLSYLIQGDISAIIERFPINRMKMIQALYFPKLKTEVDTLSTAVKDFRKLAIMERKNLRETQKYSVDFKKQHDPMQNAVLTAIEALLKKASAMQGR